MFCEHNAKERKEGLCSKCAELKPYVQFKYCKKQCFDCKECGWFYGPGAHESLVGKPVKFGDEPVKKAIVLYTAETVRISIALMYDVYFAKLAVGQSDTWIADERTKDLFCLAQWITDELTRLGCPDEDRKAQQRFFNRKSRATDDLYDLAATTINGFLTGNIDTYKGKG